MTWGTPPRPQYLSRRVRGVLSPYRERGDSALRAQMGRDSRLRGNDGHGALARLWIPAYAGMTARGRAGRRLRSGGRGALAERGDEFGGVEDAEPEVVEADVLVRRVNAVAGVVNAA